MTKLTEKMKAYAYDKATVPEKLKIESLYGKAYIGLNCGDIIPEVGLILTGKNGQEAKITEVFCKETIFVYVKTDKAKSAFPWKGILEMEKNNEITIR